MNQVNTSTQGRAVVNSGLTKAQVLERALTMKKQSFMDVLPQNMRTPKMVERFIKLALVAASKNPKLLSCSPVSIAQAMIDSAQLGLEPFGGLQQAYIIPYENRTNGTVEAQFMPSYRGLIALARRSGQIQSIEAHIVHEGDDFEFEFGLESKLRHKPSFNDTGAVLFAYAIAKFKDGGYQYEVMTVKELESIRGKSKSKNGVTWTDPVFRLEMYKKTVLKRLTKLLPMAVEESIALSAAIEKDNSLDTGETYIDVENFDVASVPDPVPQSESLLEKFKDIKEESEAK
jgi:recombination protein RecT